MRMRFNFKLLKVMPIYLSVIQDNALHLKKAFHTEAGD